MLLNPKVNQRYTFCQSKSHDILKRDKPHIPDILPTGMLHIGMDLFDHKGILPNLHLKPIVHGQQPRGRNLNATDHPARRVHMQRLLQPPRIPDLHNIGRRDHILLMVPHIHDRRPHKHLHGRPPHPRSPPLDCPLGRAETDDGVGSVLADDGVGLPGGVLGHDVAGRGVVVGELVQAAAGQQEVVGEVLEAQGRGQLVDLRALFVVDKQVLFLRQSEQILGMQEGPSADLIVEVYLQDELLVPPIEQTHMPHGATQHHGAAIPRIIHLIIPKWQIQLELITRSLQVHQVANLLLPDPQSLFALIGFEISWFGLVHQAEHFIGVVPSLRVLLSVLELGIELFILALQFLGEAKVAQHYININMEEVVEQYYLSPIANPIAGDKLLVKILKLTKALNQQKKLKRGVKQVVKSIRKGVTGICILAADVNPVDVISHIPLLCEENGIPYIYVRSRLELGAAAQTKKPTSVVILQKSDSSDSLNEKYDKLFERIKEANPYL